MYSQQEILQQLQGIMQELFETPADSIKPESRLYEDLDLDSIDAIDMLVKLQEILNKKVNQQDFKNARTVADIIAAVEKIL